MWSGSQVRKASASNSFLKISLPDWERSHAMAAKCVLCVRISKYVCLLCLLCDKNKNLFHYLLCDCWKVCKNICMWSLWGSMSICSPVDVWGASGVRSACVWIFIRCQSLHLWVVWTCLCTCFFFSVCGAQLLLWPDSNGSPNNGPAIIMSCPCIQEQMVHTDPEMAPTVSMCMHTSIFKSWACLLTQFFFYWCLLSRWWFDQF